MKKKVNKKVSIPQHPMFEALGKILRAIREQKGLTQSELANEIKVHSQFVSNWERGLCAPPQHSFVKLNKALHIGPKTRRKISLALKRDFNFKMQSEYKGLI
jgi:transcriptional regulator with XRE-family HTH domain